MFPYSSCYFHYLLAYVRTQQQLEGALAELAAAQAKSARLERELANLGQERDVSKSAERR